MRATCWPRSATVALLTLLGLGGTLACATNPATGERQLSLIGEEREIEMGRQADEEIVASMGLYGDEEIQGYVRDLGERMAATSERPDLPWTFRVVDEPVVNAFALPGGFVYVTRDIMAHFNSEAQLVAVLGHEIGHVTARHSVNRLSQQQLASLGLGIGSILSPQIAQFQGLLSAGLQLAFLSFSRDDEREADDLGLRYLTDIGYDPRDMPGVFRMLGRASGGEGGRAPEWLSTHPDPEDRVQRLQEQIAELDLDSDTLTVGREAYLRSLDGMVFGEDPRNGYFAGGTFLHPELRFRMEFPREWQTVNQARLVAAQSQEGDAVITLTLAEEASAEDALQAFRNQQGVQTAEVRSGTLNDLPAVRSRFRVRTEEGSLLGTAAFVEHGDRVYQLLGYTAEGRYDRHRSTFEGALGSFDRLEDRRLIEVEPKRIEIVRVPRAMTLSEFDDEWSSSISLERLAVLNQVEDGETLESGRLMKRVVGEELPEPR